MTHIYDTMNELLIDLVPALTDEYQEWLDDFDGDSVGPHLVYADLVRHIRAALDAGNDDAYFAPIFGFIEELAEHTDDLVLSVVYTTVVEGLVDTVDEDVLRRIIQLMGPTTRQITYEVAESRRHCEQIRSLLSQIANDPRQG